mgnify:CR=1 FL=1
MPAAATVAILDDYQRQAMSLADWGAFPLGTTTVVYSEPARDHDVTGDGDDWASLADAVRDKLAVANPKHLAR